MSKRVVPFLVLSLLSLPAWSQVEAPAPAQDQPQPAPTLADGESVPQTVLVSGSRPGPGLWKVSKDDHVMWVFGSYSPLPAKMEWHSRGVEKIIAGSQEYLKGPGSSIEVGWSGLAAIAFLPGFRKNPDGKELKDVLPPDVYARWQSIKEKYFANDTGVERERPAFVADALYDRAIRRAALSKGDEVQKKIGELAGKYKLKLTDATYRVEIKEPVKAIREFKRSAMDDVACLAKTIDSLDANVDVLRARANAWAEGKLDEIRKFNFAYADQACAQAIGTSGIAALQPELKDLHERSAQRWIAAAEKALAANASTFTVVQIRDILDPKGVIATLQAKGYTVEPPK